jgi:sucrose phosphorylase
VRSLCELIRVRNSHPAFNGEFTLLDSSPERLLLRWSAGQDWIELDADLATREWVLRPPHA